MTRVLHCYSGNLHGGVETLLTTLASHRDAASEMVPEFALCFDGGRLAADLRAAGATVHHVGEVRLGRPWTVLAARRRLRRLIAAGSFDAAVCHSCWPHAVFAPAIRRAGLPLAFWMHDAVGGRHFTERLAARTPPDLAIVNSRHTATTLPKLFPGVRSEILYYPVAAPTSLDRETARAEVRRELGEAPDAVAIVQASRLEWWKGQSLHVEALGRLRDRPGWVAWLAGGAQRPHEVAYLEGLKATAASLGIADRVKFLGQRSDIPRLLAAADVHCQPNTGPEPFGIAFVEALYAGLPAVSTRMGGAAEIIDETCGRLVTPGDPAALARSLAAMIDDPDLRRRLGSAGPARASALCEPSRAIGRLAGLLSGLAVPGRALAAT